MDDFVILKCVQTHWDTIEMNDLNILKKHLIVAVNLVHDKRKKDTKKKIEKYIELVRKVERNVYTSRIFNKISWNQDDNFWHLR